jgi:hypothetical protein
MRINLSFKIFMSLIFIFGLQNVALAKDSGGDVKAFNFVPGRYTLVKATSPDTEEACGEGVFKFVENKTQILLGPKHGFSLKDKMEKTVAMDDPDEKGCIYINSNTYTPGDDSSILSNKEVLLCNGVARHTFIETVSIKKDKIHLEFKQTGSKSSQSPGDVDAEYKCDWVLSDRSAASVSKKVKKKK